VFRRFLLQPIHMIFALGVGLSLWQVLQVWNTTIPIAGAAMLGVAAVASLGFHLQLRADVQPVVAACASLGFLILGSVLLADSLASSTGMALAFCTAALGIVASISLMAYEVSQHNFKAAVATTQATVEEHRTSSTESVPTASIEEQLLMKLNLQETKDDEIVLQSWTRSVSQGCEQVEGHLNVDFPIDQRVVHVHVPFTPAFSGDIQAWCECEAGETTAEVESAHRYGMRVRVRRGGSLANAFTTALHFVVSESESSMSDVA